VANGYFGVGWIWLVYNTSGELKITVTHHSGSPFIFPESENASYNKNLMTFSDEKFVESVVPEQWPILGLSLWEHAYLGCHHVRRENYVSAFWSAIHWQKVASRLKFSKSVANSSVNLCS